MDNLNKFLTAWDLDDALHASESVDIKNAEVEAAVRNIINTKWNTDKQAVYNLLQNCYVIPEDIRFNTLMKGIDDTTIRAYNLAAVIGLQSYRFSADQVPIAKEKLLRLASSTSAPGNARALTSLSGLSKYPDDFPAFLKIYATTANNDVKVLPNVNQFYRFYGSKDSLRNFKQSKELSYGARASILQYYNTKPKEEFVEAIKAQNMLSAEDLDSLASTHGSDDLSFGLLSYIPNLKEIEPMERYRARILSMFDQVDVEKKGKIDATQFCTFLQAIGKTITTEEAAEMIKDSKRYQRFDDGTFLTRADWYDILQGKLRFQDIDYPQLW